ncbi:hypothetical protein [Candidatus Thiosymbion oneisti]|uniref:hypothetical protein n=1 Tax=Candidatus Thiosymbion oneisti TaxID=589554 RepID=UPI000B7DBAC8|nr:hypothetical protein [Candidatus Thiosymbion oneisti]
MQMKLAFAFILVWISAFPKHSFLGEYGSSYEKLVKEAEVEIEEIKTAIGNAILSVNSVLGRNGFSNLCLSIEGDGCIKVDVIDTKSESGSLAMAVYPNKIKMFPIDIQQFIGGFPEEIPQVNYDKIMAIKGVEKWKDILRIAEIGRLQLLNSGLKKYVEENKVNLLKIIMLHEVGHIVNKHEQSGFSAYDSEGKRYAKGYYEKLELKRERINQENEADSFVAEVIKKNAKFDREKLPDHCLTTPNLPPKEMMACLSYMDEESQIYAAIGMLINAYNARRSAHYRGYNCPELANWDLPVDYLDYSPEYSHSLLRLVTMAKEVEEEGSPERKALEYRLRDLVHLNDYKNFRKEISLKELFISVLSFKTPSNLDSFEMLDDMGMDRNGVFSAMREELSISTDSERASLGKVRQCMFYDIIDRCKEPIRKSNLWSFYGKEISDFMCSFKFHYEGRDECLKVLGKELPAIEKDECL